ncbi:MAG: EAL domain-containing protein [Legionellales bacterium]|nr:EAL domain-containing protein [Legionellales bacterium]
MEENTQLAESTIEEKTQESLQSAKLTILIVDDETELLASLKRPLKLRYNIMTLDKSIEVMSTLRSHPVDCILLDIRMPGMTGIEVLKELKFVYPHLPVLIMTGHGDEEDTINTLKYGASGYIKKPIDIYVLFDELQRVLTLDRQMSDLKRKPAKILLLDDDKDVLESVKKVLSFYPYEVTGTTSTSEGLLNMEEGNFDIVIVDLQMPTMSGLDFIDEAKKKSTNFIPIVLTGNSSQELAIDAIKHGVFDYIRKPLDVSELVSAIERSMHKLEINREIYQKNRELTAKEKLLENLNNEITLQKNYLENIVRSISNILIITDEKGEIKTTNDAAINLLGYSAEEMIGNTINRVLNLKNFDKFIKKLGKDGGISNIEAKFSKKDTSFLFVLYSGTIIRNQRGELEGFVFVAQDISERKVVEEQLHQLSYYDSLTKLPNRLYFEMEAKQLLGKLNKAEKLSAFLYLDLDGFKSVNDRLGHPVGDKLLQEIGRRLENAFRAGDFVARIGGDEFVACLGSIVDRSDAGIVAQRLISLINRPFFIDNNEISIGTSIGISTYPDTASNYDQLFKNADIALYKAKHAGRNQYQYFTKQLNVEYGRQLDIESALHFAIERKEFHMVFQPIYNLITKKIVAMEALLRWNSAEFGEIYPQDFIPIAEYAGLIIPISEWVLDTVLRQYAAWQKEFDIKFRIALNISACQLNKGEYFSELLRQACRTHEVTPSNIELELTETAIMHNPKQAEGLLNELHQLGFILSIDDFGQGYSSLSLLSRLPISILKIDKQFIENLNVTKDEFIVKSVISLSKGLNMHVIAEGIETKKQCDYLIKNDCECGQGFLFSKPLIAEDLRALIIENS